MIDWKYLLTRWSGELIASELAARVTPPPATNSWLGFDPATEDEIAALESRLGVLLPPSYKAFLRTSNGWGRTTPFIRRVRPTAEVDWFRVENESWAEIFGESGWDVTDEEYFKYSAEGAPGHRAKHMKALLQISDVEDGVYVLNPEAVTPDGEWEAWFFANWVPGAERFPSFTHLMLNEYEVFRQLGKIATPFEAVQLTIPPASVPRVPAEWIRSRAAKAKTLDVLLKEIQVADERLRNRAIRAFFGKLKGRSKAKRRPDLIQPLTDLYYRTPYADARCACVAALTELGDDAPAPKPLFDALSDPDPDVVLQGMFALHYFPNDAAVEPLCCFVRSKKNILYSETAMSRLADIGDPKAIPILLGVLLDTSNKFDQSFTTAGGSIGRLGREGFEALVGVLKHHDARVRVGAVIGIDISGDARAGELLDAMANDPDETVRKRAAYRVGKFPY